MIEVDGTVIGRKPIFKEEDVRKNTAYKKNTTWFEMIGNTREPTKCHRGRAMIPRQQPDSEPFWRCGTGVDNTNRLHEIYDL